jgi:muramoyltetrapeptide carboxypeptidase
LKKLRTLKSGATLAIVSPASTPRPELVQQGIAALEDLGYKTVLYPSALQKGPLYYAGSIEQRLSDLHDAFKDSAIDAILCTRGGWGSAELLPFLDAELIRANTKPFLGYSDHTSLQIWLKNVTDTVTFYAPMVAADFSRRGGADLPSWRHALEGSASWTLDGGDGLRVLRPGVAEGPLQGGCLSIYAEALGTPYAPQPQAGVLFLEDIGVKPYQWDRLLLHLRYAGILDRVTGIVFGDMRQCCPPEDDALLDAALLHALRDFAGPIAIGLRSGHVGAPNITLPLGVRVRLDLADREHPRMHFLEAATEG